MGGTCSCFGESQSDRHGVATGSGSHGTKNSFLQNVVNKFKSISHKGQGDNTASTGGSRSEARVAAAEPLGTNTSVASGAASMQRVPPTHQPNPAVNNQNSLNSQPSGQPHLSLNKPTKAQGGSTVTPQRKSNVRKVSKPLVKDTIEANAKQLVDSSSEEFKDAIEIFSSSDDEDVCPTCLEEYDDENPKITSECNHHFHLSCIFEWMERSSSCPVCGRAMVFEQMT